MSPEEHSSLEGGLRKLIETVQAHATSLSLSADLLARSWRELEHHRDVERENDDLRKSLARCASPPTNGAGEVRHDLEAKVQAAEGAVKAKDDLLAMLSHELRTPLTPVLAAAQLMEDDPALSPEQRDNARSIRRNVELEARLIDDLLDLTRIRRNKLELRPAITNVHDDIEHVVQILAAATQAKRLRVLVEPAAEHSHVQGDSSRLQQVLWNLLSNAIKFTPPEGAIALRTANAGSDGSPPRVMVCVSDNGIGIAPDVLPLVFDAFEQGGRDVTRRFGGLGLGLAINKAVAEMHGGTLTAASDGVGKGARFTLTLPTVSHAANAAAPACRCIAPPAQGQRSLRILLVEDHADTLKLMTRLVESMGHNVVGASDKASAIQAATGEAFDLVISDIGLPDGSGLDLMRELRGIDHGLRGIAVTGHGMSDDMARSADAGFAAHITKPVELAELEAVIRQVAGT